MKKWVGVITIFFLAIATSAIASSNNFIVFENPIAAANFLELIKRLIDYLFWLSVILVPLMIMTAAFFFMIGAGNPEQVGTANRILIYTFIGFIVISSARGIVGFLVERLTI